MIERAKNWLEIQKNQTKKWLQIKLEPLEKVIWLKCCVPLLDRFDKEPQIKKRNDEQDRNIIGTQEQFQEYRKRKKILLRRMGLGAIGMCCLIIFLAWLQWYIPEKHRAFWSTGMGQIYYKKPNRLCIKFFNHT